MKIDLYHLYRGFHFSKLTYPIALDVLRVWAETNHWEARVSICKEGKVDLDTDAEVVGISVYSQTAPAAYRVAAQLRARGKIVMLRRPALPRREHHAEAAPYCDVIAESLCEAQMRELLDAVAEGRLAPNRAQPLSVADRAGRFRTRRTSTSPCAAVAGTRSRPIPTSDRLPLRLQLLRRLHAGARIVLRDIETVYNELAYAPGTLALFCDASFGLNKKHTLDLMDAVAPLRKKIGVETTLGAAAGPATSSRRWRRGGVKWLVVGIETLAAKLRKHGTSDLERGLRSVLTRAHDLGMMMQGNFICGLDADGPESFEQIYEFYDRSGLDAIMMGILTPYPDTALYRPARARGPHLRHATGTTTTAITSSTGRAT